MVEIYLCRHGQSQANADSILAGHLDSPLNDIGKQQANELAQLAKDAGLRFDHVYCSPLSRAKDTAAIIAASTGSPAPEVMDELIERDFGILTGKPYLDIPKYSKNIFGTDVIGYFLDGEGVETFPEALKRAERVLKDVHERHKNGKVLLVAHGDIGMMLFAAFHNDSWEVALKHFHFGNSELLLLHEDSKHSPHVFTIDQRGLSEKP